MITTDLQIIEPDEIILSMLSFDGKCYVATNKRILRMRAQEEWQSGQSAFEEIHLPSPIVEGIR